MTPVAAPVEVKDVAGDFVVGEFSDELGEDVVFGLLTTAAVLADVSVEEAIVPVVELISVAGEVESALVLIDSRVVTGVEVLI